MKEITNNEMRLVLLFWSFEQLAYESPHKDSMVISKRIRLITSFLNLKTLDIENRQQLELRTVQRGKYQPSELTAKDSKSQFSG